MGMKINTELPLPAYLKAKYPLPEELVKKGFACGVLGIDEMRERIRGWEMFAWKTARCS